MLKTLTNGFGRKRWLIRFTHEIVVLQRCWIPLRPRKRGAEEGLALHTCVCLGALDKKL